MLIKLNEYEFYLVCGKTDMRSGAFSLSRRIQDELKMDPLEKNIFIFCGSNNKCIKALVWDKNGFFLLQKRLLSKGTFRWPNDKKEALKISRKDVKLLLEGADIFRRFPTLKGKLAI
ncbi:MAG: IS66 family insertion sequence element accessory protein TnpB [Sphaerochaetaceae bacterium]|nr:IS66 family insertion sequence element accessory protein TnpB [Sphaerochaetaceae bacterium]